MESRIFGNSARKRALSGDSGNDKVKTAHKNNNDSDNLSSNLSQPPTNFDPNNNSNCNNNSNQEKNEEKTAPGDRQPEKKVKDDEIDSICAAAVRITKSLLGYGAENNWGDVENSKGRSWNAGIYRKEWLYVSAKDRLSTSIGFPFFTNTLNKTNNSASNKNNENKNEVKDNSEEKNLYFYHQPKLELPDPKQNYIARKAVCAILAHTGACDEHAYVLAMLLRLILPKGTIINICGFRNIKTKADFAHTFVVIGPIQQEKNSLASYLANNNLWVADAWPIIGGVVKLKNFWLSRDMHGKHLPDYQLKVDHTFIADQSDHFIGRVWKQVHLLSLNEKHEISCKQSGNAFYLNDLEMQSNITKRVNPMSLFGYKEDSSMWFTQTVSENYEEPENTIPMLYLILEKHPELKALLKWCDEQLTEVPTRLASGPEPLPKFK